MLTGLEVMFMGVTRSNSGFSVLQVLLSHMWEKEKVGGKKEDGRREKGNRKGKEGREKE